MSLPFHPTSFIPVKLDAELAVDLVEQLAAQRLVPLLAALPEQLVAKIDILC